MHKKVQFYEVFHLRPNSDSITYIWKQEIHVLGS